MRSAARLRNVGLDTADIESFCINVHADAGPPKINHKKTNNERQCCHRFEVRRHLQPNTTDLLHILHAGDAMHNRAEDDRANEHPDCGDEHVAERFQAGTGGGEEVSDQNAKDDRGEDLEVEVAIQRLRASRGRRGHARRVPRYSNVNPILSVT
jgi:hypothetical protein